MLHHGDLFDVLPTLAANSVDAVVTDPPYELGFMARAWDCAGVAFQVSTWAEVARVLKPGGHLVAFGGSRTSHRLVCAIEDAGFEIRDSLAWLYGSGFPKSLDVARAIDMELCPLAGRHCMRTIPPEAERLAGDHVCATTPEGAAWAGWGTALKPGFEPICLARKPFADTVAAQVRTHGTGALNIGDCRIGSGGQWQWSTPRDMGYHGGSDSDGKPTNNDVGRWPANVVLDEDAAALLDAQSGELVSGANPERRGSDKFRGIYSAFAGQSVCTPARGVDSGGASRFFYVAKPSREERDYGCEALEARTGGEATGRADDAPGTQSPRAGAGRHGGSRNVHPTVKPIALMRWLVRLVTPIGGTVLDPFAGSGTTGMACRYELRAFVGVEREAEYVRIAERRIAAVAPLFG